MEIYLSEEERVDALKKWWKENLRSVIVGVALGLTVIVGWNAWQHAKLRKAEDASALYQQLLKAVDAKQADPATKLSEKIIQDHQGSAYATYATLFLAKLKVGANDLPGAKKVLSDLLASLKDDHLKQIVRLRLARVLLASGESEEGLKLLEPLTSEAMGAFESQYEELKGDLYVDLHRPNDARTAYERAKQLGAASPLLDIKINDLGSETLTKPAV